jgi:hypothetical protein
VAYVIAEPCIGVKDVQLHRGLPSRLHSPNQDEPGWDQYEQLYIDPASALTATPVSRRARWT